MSIFRNSRRIADQTIERKLFTTPPRIYYGIVNKDKNISAKEEIKTNPFKYVATGDKRYLIRNNVSHQEIPAQNEQTDRTIYNITPDNHVTAQNIVKYNDLVNNNNLKANRNEIVYHQVYMPKVKQRLTFFKPLVNVGWFAKKSDEKGGAVKESGGRLGKLGSANESGFFHKTDKDILLDLKKKIKDKGEEPDDTSKKS